ncbi:MAG: phosphonopyruvate decarboxylase [Eubacterium sp.]|nr:phosphonopyruvate decarboxylase [Eubacterium sp.]
MRAESFFRELGADFYTGVPDSQLKALCDFLLDYYGTDPKHHIIAANEGNAVGIAAGYHMATGRVPVVYMQNSGEGNAINPMASLLSDEVYGIPCIFVIGWRGEPGVHDEPQHIYQGKITCELLDVMDIEYRVLSKDTTEEELRDWMSAWQKRILTGKSVAIVVRKGALAYDGTLSGNNDSNTDGAERFDRGDIDDGGVSVYDNYPTREKIIETIVRYSGDDPIVSTTGKASRELFEIRERDAVHVSDIHGKDFLTVGSMGHCSSIALGIALQKADRRVWCIDGDGAALMHMGAMAVISNAAPDNLIHIVINNGVHETVGGQPAATRNMSLKKLSESMGYACSYRAESLAELDIILKKITSVERTERQGGPVFIEVMSSPGSRDDLGRPTTSARENKEAFMRFLS